MFYTGCLSNYLSRRFAFLICRFAAIPEADSEALKKKRKIDISKSEHKIKAAVQLT